MLRPKLTTPTCYSSSEDTFSIYCSCERCMSRPSLTITNIDKNLSRNEVEIVLNKLGKIREIGQDLTVHIKEWNETYSHMREVLGMKQRVKLKFQDAHGEKHIWYLEENKSVPRSYNKDWEKELDISIEVPANNIDISIPGSCTPRKDGKTETNILEEIKMRDTYYFLKNLYQTYDLNTYEEKVSKYGEGFLWDLDTNLSKDKLTKQCLKRLNLPKIYLQTPWIPQIVKAWHFNNGIKEYYMKPVEPYERAIKDRIYVPARKKLMLSIMIDKTIVVPFKDKSLKLSNSNKKYIGQKNNAMEELLARFWFCVERKSTITANNLVGSTDEWRLKLAETAQEYHKTLFGGEVVSIPANLSRHKIKDIWCECMNVHECEECRNTNVCYACYFCDRIHIHPREWHRWQELYHTVPRCGCQYRIITRENP